MISAILIEDRESLVPIYALNLGVFIGVEVQHKKNHLEAVDFLRNNPNSNVGLIITKSLISDVETANSIYKFLSEQGLKIPIIILGKGTQTVQYGMELDSQPELRTLVRTAAQILGITAEKMAALAVPEHYPIPTSHFKNVGPLVCDVYAKKNDTFIRTYEQGKKIPQEEVDQLEKSGEFFLYVPAKCRLKFAHAATERMLEALRNESLSTEERLLVTDEGLQLVSEEMRNCGFQENIIKLAEESIKSIAKVAAKGPTLTALINDLLSDKVSFRFKHCQVLTYVCFHILENLEWGTKEQQEKLAFVSFFHDIALASDDEAMIHSDEELDESKLSSAQKETVRNHALLAASLVKDLPNLPLGAEIIIKQHHGSRTGTGLSQLSTSIPPLAQVFVVAEEWTHVMLKSHQQGKKISNVKLLKYLRQKTGNVQNYAKIIDTLEKLKI